jgi:hypothetical protein
MGSLLRKEVSMAFQNDRNIVLEDVRIIFRNFAGRKGKYNKEGERSFAVILDHEQAEGMKQAGWNIKYLKAREEGELDQPYLSVKVRFDGPRPPRIVLVSSHGRTTMQEEQLDLIDGIDIRMVDMIVRPYDWNVDGETGVKAYLKSMFVTIDEDELDRKYADR